jgi:hypothetical protein
LGDVQWYDVHAQFREMWAVVPVNKTGEEEKPQGVQTALYSSETVKHQRKSPHGRPRTDYKVS